MMASVDEVDRLLLVLAAEERVYVELRDLLQKERECMVNLDADSLVELTARKEVLGDEARLIEESRVEVACELARSLGISGDRVALSALCERLGPTADRLRDSQGRLVVLVTVVRELLEANRALAGDGLTQIRGTLQLLGRLLPMDPIYASDASAEIDPGAGRLIRRTA